MQRWRTELAVRTNVNCRTHWSSTPWTLFVSPAPNDDGPKNLLQCLFWLKQSEKGRHNEAVPLFSLLWQKISLSFQMWNVLLNSDNKQDKAITDTSYQIQHDMNMWKSSYKSTTSCTSSCCWKCHRRSPLLVWHASPLSFLSLLHFLWELRLLSSVSPDEPERVTSERPTRSTLHKDTKVRTDNEAQRSLGPDPPGRQALTVTAPSAEDDTSGETMEDVTKQIKSGPWGLLWMKMKVCHTPLYCSSVAPTRPTGTREKIGFQKPAFHWRGNEICPWCRWARHQSCHFKQH